MLQLTAHQAKSLKTKEVNTLQTAIDKAVVKTFENSCTLAKLIFAGYSWIKSEEGKAFYKGQALGMDEFCEKIYGYKKAQYHKLRRAGEAIEERPEILAAFIESVNEAKCNDLTAPLSIENFNNYLKQVEKTAPSQGESEGEESESESESAPKVTKEKALLTLAFNGEILGLKNVSLKIDANGLLKTSNNINDLLTALDYLRQALGQPSETPQPAPKKAAKGKAPKKAAKVEILDSLQGAFTSEVFDLSEHA